MRKKKEETIQEVVQKTIDELCNLIGELDEDEQSGTAVHACFEIVNWVAYNHLEALGIFEEAKLLYRNSSIETMEEEN